MSSAGDDENANASTLAMASSDADSFDDVLMRLVRPREIETEVALAVGFEIAGRFRIVRMLGVGGMGTVYLARDQSLDREVAIKVHHQRGGADRLRREAVAMARLAHPHVVTVFEVGELGRRPFVVMEYIAGTTLRAWLREAPRGAAEILAAVVAAGEGLAAAHAAGLVHRDFKPENVMIGSDGRARVGDFGLARELDSQDLAAPSTSASASTTTPPGTSTTTPPGTPTGAPTKPPSDAPASGARRSTAASTPMRAMTQTGAVLGTPAYMAPEQFAGVPVDARADQFAYCVTVWEALFGQRPFAGTTFELLKAAITGGVRTPPTTAPAVPARVRAAL
ncbi:MAG: serine/threonine-protein kinase, partial [Kofleriaceae bacterium]